MHEKCQVPKQASRVDVRLCGKQGEARGLKGGVMFNIT